MLIDVILFIIAYLSVGIAWGAFSWKFLPGFDKTYRKIDSSIDKPEVCFGVFFWPLVIIVYTTHKVMAYVGHAIVYCVKKLAREE